MALEALRGVDETIVTVITELPVPRALAGKFKVALVMDICPPEVSVIPCTMGVGADQSLRAVSEMFTFVLPATVEVPVERPYPGASAKTVQVPLSTLKV